MLASPTKGAMLNRYTRRHLICHWSVRGRLRSGRNVDSAKAGQLDVFRVNCSAGRHVIEEMVVIMR